MTGVVAALVLILIITVVSVQKSGSKETVLNKISNAIDNNDAELLVSTFPKEMQSYATAKDSAQYLIKTALENKTLMMQLLDTENNEVADSVKEMRLRGEIPYEVVKSGKSMLIFDKYVLQPNTTYITMEELPKNVTVTLNGKPVTHADLQEPFLPGKYEFQAAQQYDYTIVTDTDTVKTGEDPSEKVSFNLTGYRIDLSKEMKNAEIVFKGKKTGVKVGDPQSAEFGPIDKEAVSNIQLAAQFPWGEALSSNYDESYHGISYFLYNGDSHVYFKPDEKAASELFLKFAQQYAEGSQKKSIQPFTVATEKYKKSQLPKYNSMFGAIEKQVLLSSYFNTETPVINIDREGNPIMELDGIVHMKRLKQDYLDEQEFAKKLMIKAVYDEEKKQWFVDEININSTVELPVGGEKEKYIITKNQA